MAKIKQDSFKEFDEVLDNLKDASPKSKDYYKFIIGLATGTLIFSVTFLKEFHIFPEYKLILIIGWLCLLVSIIAGVLVLPKLDHLHARVQSLKGLLKSSEEIGVIVKKELQQHYIKTWIKSFIDPVFKDDKNRKEELYKTLDKLSTKRLKKFLKSLGLAGVKDSTAIHFIGDFFKEMFKFLSLIKMVEREKNPIFVFKSVRQNILQMFWFDRVMKYTFFVGIIAISFFSIINFLR
ncbi:MAG: hypothetical protein JXA50_09435 [Deltaproteobacteria bacterium]|nr:hypothetical protein [Deltaproteobacteria bacterium]